MAQWPKGTLVAVAVAFAVAVCIANFRKSIL